MSDSLTVTVIQCSGKGCNNSFTTSQPVSKEFTYACKLHPKRKQKNIPVFQTFQHDKALDGKEQEDFGVSDPRTDDLLNGEPLDPKKKCVHGVYDPSGDQRYCTVCNPVHVTGPVLHVKKLKVDLGDGSKHKVGTFKNPGEQVDQAVGILAFAQLALKKKPAWLRDVHFPTVDDLEGLTNQFNA